MCQVQKHSGESVELTVSFGEDVLGIAGSEVVSWRIDLDTVYKCFVKEVLFFHPNHEIYEHCRLRTLIAL